MIAVNLKFLALPSGPVRALQAGELDANGQAPEICLSDGSGNPCRHCLREIPAGERMLVLAYRPFPSIQPYAEIGPIFLCADKCERRPDSADLPDMFNGWERILLRGYGANDRILYGTGQVVEVKDIVNVATKLFDRQETAYVHMRSASNNCYHCRIEKS